MNKLLLLVKNELKKLFSFKKFTNVKKIFIFLLAIYVIGTFGTMISTFTINGTEYLSKFNLQNNIITIINILTVIMIFITSMFNSKSILFKIEDNLLAMPIKKITILLAKFISLYLVMLPFTLILAGISLVTFGIIQNLSIIYYLFTILTLIFIPIIPTVIGSIIGYFIAYLTSKVKCKKLFETVMTFLVFLIIMFMQYFVTYIITKINFSNIDINKIFSGILQPIRYVEEYLIYNNYLSLIYYILINIIILTLFILIFKKCYISITQKLNVHNVNSKYIEKKVKQKSIFNTLLLKETKRYFSIPIYVFNTSFMLIVILILAIISLFIDKEVVITMLNTYKVNIVMILTYIIGIISVMSISSNVSISIEGKKLQLLKVLPVKTKDILLAKVAFNILLICIPIFILLLLLYISLDFSIYALIHLYIFTFILSVFVSLFGIIVNLKFPKLEFDNYTQVVKQSASPLITLIVLLPVIIGIFGYTMYINLNIWNFLIIFDTATIIFNIILYYLMITWGVKVFKKID